MNCQDFLHRYSDYDDSLLSPAEQELFASHLGRCPRCARYDRVLRKGRMLARQIPPAPPSRDFVPRLHQRLLDRRRERSRRSATRVLGGAAPALAGVTVMLTVLWAVSILDPAPTGPGVAGARPEAVADEAYGAVGGRDPASAWPSARPRAGSTGMRAVLPTAPIAPTAAEAAGPKGWASAGVDHRVPVAYSPLVTGPPAYRVAGAFQLSASTTTSHPPD